MLSGFLITLWVLVVILLLFGGLLLNFLGLGGNWLMLGTMMCHRFLIEPSSRLSVEWSTLGWILLFALVAEGIEFISGFSGAGKAGASRRAMLLSMVGSLIGAGMGFGLGNAVFPVLGGILGVFLLGAAGALGGALLGELWKGRDFSASMSVGRSAFVGRLIGTVSKAFLGTLLLGISIGSLMV